MENNEYLRCKLYGMKETYSFHKYVNMFFISSQWKYFPEISLSRNSYTSKSPVHLKIN